MSSYSLKLLFFLELLIKGILFLLMWFWDAILPNSLNEGRERFRASDQSSRFFQSLLMSFCLPFSFSYSQMMFDRFSIWSFWIQGSESSQSHDFLRTQASDPLFINLNKIGSLRIQLNITLNQNEKYNLITSKKLYRRSRTCRSPGCWTLLRLSQDEPSNRVFALPRHFKFLDWRWNADFLLRINRIIVTQHPALRSDFEWHPI
jgi:hypothetical protein